MIGDLARPVLKSMTTMDSLSPDLMRSSVAELEQALFNHEQWCEGLYSTLICRLPPDQRDMEVDAHRRCRFGQWYYGTGSIKLSSHRGFEEIAIEHQRMHQYAATLLNASTHRVPISVQDYERFDSALKRMRLEIATLKHDIEDALYNLDPLTGAASRIGMLTKLREEQELGGAEWEPRLGKQAAFLTLELVAVRVVFGSECGGIVVHSPHNSRHDAMSRSLHTRPVRLAGQISFCSRDRLRS